MEKVRRLRRQECGGRWVQASERERRERDWRHRAASGPWRATRQDRGEAASGSQHGYSLSIVILLTGVH